MARTHKKEREEKKKELANIEQVEQRTEECNPRNKEIQIETLSELQDDINERQDENSVENRNSNEEVRSNNSIRTFGSASSKVKNARLNQFR